jgi:hypothetical protein
MTITHSSITDNEAKNGGGLWIGGNGGGLVPSNAHVINSVFANNTAILGGGVYLSCIRFTLTMSGCTITDNTATENTNDVLGGGGIFHEYGYKVNENRFFSTLILNNSLVVGNSSDIDTGEHWQPYLAFIEGSHNLIGDGFRDDDYFLENGKDGNIVGTTASPIDPLFVDFENGNYHLTADSLAVNQGNNAFIPSGVTTDFEGNNRIRGGIVDIGAYESEYQGTFSAQITGITSGTVTPQVGIAITTTLAPSGASATYKWYRGEEEIEGTTASTYTPTEEDAGCFLRVVATGSGDYEGEVEYEWTNEVVLASEDYNAHDLAKVEAA